MSRYSSSTVLTTSVPVKSKEEIEAWIVEFGRKNEAELRAAGVPFVDFRVPHQFVFHSSP